MKCDANPFGTWDFQVEAWRLEARADGLDELVKDLSGPVIEVNGRLLRLPDFTAEVRAGARLLDLQKPGWWRHIDTSALDLAQENVCVLGQAWSHYEIGSKLMFGAEANREVLAKHGFTISGINGRLMNFQMDFNASSEIWMAAWEHLTATWLVEIRARQEAAELTFSQGTYGSELVAAGVGPDAA